MLTPAGRRVHIPHNITSFYELLHKKYFILLKNTPITMVQLKLSFLLSTAVALSLPLAAKAQEKESNFLTCIFQSMSSGNITIEGDLSQVVDSVVASCCPEGTEEPTCTALQCMNYEVSFLVYQILYQLLHAPLSTLFCQPVHVVDEQPGVWLQNAQ